LLVELNISNYAVIDKLSLTLGPGFNVLTGETGAGKSIILDALGLLLGDRVDGGQVRAGADKALIEGIFELPPDLAAAVGQLLGGDVEADGLILAREVSSGGRSICRINGSAVPQRRLAEVGAKIVDIHGQGDHLSLLRPSEHLGLLDRYAGLGGRTAEFAALVKELGSTRRQLKSLRIEQQERAARAELLRFQAAEIAAAQLTPGEEEALAAERTLRLNAEKATQLAEEAVNALDPDHIGQAGAIELIGRSVRALSALEHFEPALEAQRGAAESAALDLEELVREVRRFAERLEYDQRRLDQIEERLDLIASLRRKYGPGVEEILAFGARASEELESRGRGEERLAELESAQAALLEQAALLAPKLSEARIAAARTLTAAVEHELQELGMEGARLGVAFKHELSEMGLRAEGVHDLTVESGSAASSAEAGAGAGAGDRLLRFDATGVDSVEFLIAANPGEPLRPLATTASGGETSRLMLAIKGALAQVDPVPVLVFDEVDAGIGGRVGEVVGRRLLALGRLHQVLAVTHLPQIASCGDRHISVRKVVEAGRTYTRAVAVTAGDRVKEIGSMLGSETDATRARAAELLERKPVH
jgi:DNA repair protein RecN (Recombination protein N)